ncbi:hypothetical protein M404DRAFT_32651 [Pisolithus tinctorius Marx 270]|uniref:Uncharacterized protein n=1 Tax=Pisolithus tinctorius Marx 270 TaxID=870435 RepID=A0A0C3N7N1_PISTI|nr:hypothetical protein M404DRAFT_32651 [Pisolithus tinctorius Marx 270]
MGQSHHGLVQPETTSEEEQRRVIDDIWIVAGEDDDLLSARMVYQSGRETETQNEQDTESQDLGHAQAWASKEGFSFPSANRRPIDESNDIFSDSNIMKRKKAKHAAMRPPPLVNELALMHQDRWEYGVSDLYRDGEGDTGGTVGADDTEHVRHVFVHFRLTKPEVAVSSPPAGLGLPYYTLKRSGSTPTLAGGSETGELHGVDGEERIDAELGSQISTFNPPLHRPINRPSRRG